VTITVLLRLAAKPEQGDRLAAAIEASLPDTRAFRGCLGAEALRDCDNRDSIVVIERWESRDDQSAYSAWRAEQGAMAALADILAARPGLTYYDTM
jgi:quinol monooxygenase YgiN